MGRGGASRHHRLDLMPRIIIVPDKLDADDVAVVVVVLVLLASPAQVVDVPAHAPRPVRSGKCAMRWCE